MRPDVLQALARAYKALDIESWARVSSASSYGDAGESGSALTKEVVSLLRTAGAIEERVNVLLQQWLSREGQLTDELEKRMKERLEEAE